VLPLAFRAAALAFASIQVVLFQNDTHIPSFVPTPYLLAAAWLYTGGKIFQPLKWYHLTTANTVLTTVDVLVCGNLVLLSGATHSPFLMYALSPVLTASLFLSRGITSAVAACTIVLVAGQQVASVVLSPLPPQESLEVFNDLPIFVASVALVSILPYATNINLNAQLRSNAATDERARLAREIHDGLCQTLSGLRWQTQLLSRHLAKQDEYAAGLHRLERLAREAEEVARGTLRSLQGASVAVRLLPLIKSELERLRKTIGVNGILLDHEKGLMELDPSVEQQLAYICQEALRNVEKHSHANNLVISLRNSNGHLMITIADDGVGFNPAESGGPGSGSGLRVMKERAESVGGLLQIVSKPGQGTQVDVDAPGKLAPEYIWQKK